MHLCVCVQNHNRQKTLDYCNANGLSFAAACQWAHNNKHKYALPAAGAKRRLSSLTALVEASSLAAAAAAAAAADVSTAKPAAKADIQPTPTVVLKNEVLDREPKSKRQKVGGDVSDAVAKLESDIKEREETAAAERALLETLKQKKRELMERAAKVTDMEKQNAALRQELLQCKN